jgi:Tol biopolymer transport system component
LRRGAWPEWSGDGRHIVFSRIRFGVGRSVLFVQEFDGLPVPRPESPGPQYCPPHFAPDGQRIAAFRRDEGAGVEAFVTLNLKGQDERAAFSRPPTVPYGCDFSWQPR